MSGERRADGLRAAVLPDDRRGERPAGTTVPRQDGLTLVGQGDRRDGYSGFVERPAAGVDHGGVESFGVLLDPAARQVIGAQCDLGNGDRLPGFVDDDGLGARGALVDGQHVGHGAVLLGIYHVVAPKYGRDRCHRQPRKRPFSSPMD